MEQLQKKPRWTSLPLLSMIFGIAGLLIACALCAFATLRVYGYAINAAIFDMPPGFLYDPAEIVLFAALVLVCLLADLATAFGIIGLVKSIRRSTRSKKGIVLSAIGIVAATCAGLFAILTYVFYVLLVI